MWRLPDNRVLKVRKTIILPSGEKFGGTDWYDPAKLAEAGIKPFREVAYDKAHYRSTGYTDEEVDGEIVRTHTIEPSMTVAELQARWVAKTKARAGSLLAPTDWYVIRETEDASKPAPQDISDYRADVRAASDSVEAAVSALSVYEDLVALNADALWPEEPAA